MMAHYTELQQTHETRMLSDTSVSTAFNQRRITDKRVLFESFIQELKQVDSDTALRPEDKTFLITYTMERFMDNEYKFIPMAKEDFFPNSMIMSTRSTINYIRDSVIFNLNIMPTNSYLNRFLSLEGFKYVDESVLSTVRDAVQEVVNVFSNESTRRSYAYLLFHAMKNGAAKYDKDYTGTKQFAYPKEWTDSNGNLPPVNPSVHVLDSERRYIEEIERDLLQLSPRHLRNSYSPMSKDDLKWHTRNIFNFISKYKLTPNIPTSQYQVLNDLIGISSDELYDLVDIRNSQEYKDYMRSITGINPSDIQTSAVPKPDELEVCDLTSDILAVFHQTATALVQHLDDKYREYNGKIYDRRSKKQAKLFATLVSKCFSKRELPASPSSWVTQMQFSGGNKIEHRKILFDYFERMLPDNLRQSMIAYRANMDAASKPFKILGGASTFGTRAYANSRDGDMQLYDQDDDSTVLHELFHFIENTNQQLHDRAVALLANEVNKYADRTIPIPDPILANQKGRTVLYGKLEQLRTLHGTSSGYKAKEVYMKSDFTSQYSSKIYISGDDTFDHSNVLNTEALVYLPQYVFDQNLPQRHIAPSGSIGVPGSLLPPREGWYVCYVYASEITTMAIESLFEDPLDFYKRDKKLFDYAVSVLRGEI
jgi:hypothetical protein